MGPTTLTKNEGLAARHFPGQSSFDQRQGGYSALPWIFRSLLAAMNPRQWMLLTLLYLRSGPEGLSWQTDQELADAMGISRKKVGPNLRFLDELGFVSIKKVGRQRYVFLPDPTSVAQKLLRDTSRLTESQRERLAHDVQLIETYRARSGRNVA